MSDDVTTAATIASLRAEVERLKAELQGEREDLAEKCKEYGDSLVEEAKLTTRIAALEAEREEWRKINGNHSILVMLTEAELDRERAALSDRNAYAERLLSENVRLTNEAADLRGQMEMLLKEVDECQSWIGGQDVRSDFPNATAMRQALDTARERAGVLEAAVQAAIRCGLTNRSWAHITSPPEAAARCDCPPCTMNTLRNALDAAKFGKENGNG